MKGPIKVLVVEDCKSDRFLAQQLLANYDLDFTWQQVASEAELRTIAQSFDPSLVFSADKLTVSARSAALDMLRLLSLQSVVIHVAEVEDSDGPPPRGMAALELRPARPPQSQSQPMPPASGTETRTPAAHWRKSLPSLLDTSTDLVAMSDSAGWITYANTNTSRLCSERREQSIGSVLGWSYDFASPGPGPHRLAWFDSVTGLPNPIHLSDVVGSMMARARGDLTALPVVALDLRGLRTMNESTGPAMSDGVLRVVGSGLKSGSGCGMIARVGEDDILVVLPDPSNPSDAAVNVKGNRRSIEPPAGSAGAGSAAAVDVAPVLRSVDDASPARPRPSVEAGLDDALQRHAIGVHYQPQFELQSGRGCGVEALARWNLINGESVPPAVFIAIAEQAGMIDALGEGVLSSACDTASAWRGREAERSTVSVNVSTRQINGRFSRIVGSTLEKSGLPACRLELEIAEAAVLGNSESIAQCLKQWKQLGVRVAVNHAGANYSSLSYLSRLPVDRLKLDKSLIHGMALDNQAMHVIHALIALGAELGIEVIAEGVETEAQFQLLTELGCRQAQGFLLGRPMPAVQAQIALRKPWGNLPRSALPSRPLDRAQGGE